MILEEAYFVPDVDFGIYILNPKYNVGFSTVQLFGAAAKIGSDAYQKFQDGQALLSVRII